MADGAVLVFEGELIRLLQPPAADGVVRYPVTRRTSIKDVIEALGPPHTEVYRLRLDERDIDFGTLLEPGMTITISPARFPIDVTTPGPLHPRALPRLAFAADANVGKLATLLRLLGLDTTYDRAIEDAELAELAAREGRVVLSRDRACLKRTAITYGRVITANDPVDQARDVMRAFGLRQFLRPFSRCLRCNQPLVSVPKATVLPVLEPRTKRYYELFWRCPSCQRVYWAGSHHDGMLRLLTRLEEEERRDARGETL